MTSKEKAIQIMDKFRTYAVMWTGGVRVENANVKQCALIVVDEILRSLIRYDDVYLYKFWEQVQEEINNS